MRHSRPPLVLLLALILFRPVVPAAASASPGPPVLVGNLTQTTLPSGAINRQGYDDRNRLVGIDPGNTGSYSIQYGYDQAGRRTSMADATGTTTYGYDAANRLTSVTALGTGQVQYAYDAAGERTTLTYPSGHRASYAYTARGQLQSVTDWNAKETGYTYDNVGQLTAIAFPNGVSGSAGATTYGYDALDRLTSAGYPNSDQVAYAYDAVGNRTSLTVNGVQTTNIFDAADRLTQAGGATYTYDPNGNQLTETAGGVTTTYSYDLLNRLTGISGPTTASYAYNGDGLRTSKTVNGTTTSYAWDPTGLGTVLGDGTGEYLWGQGLIGQVTASATTYVQGDGLGSVRLLTDGSGNVAGRQGFDAYGASRTQTGAQLPFGYTGEQTDAESGLVYLRARYYDPASGRLLTRDSYGGAAGDPQSLNRYGYGEGDPTANTDPSGHCLEDLCIGETAAAIAIVTQVAPSAIQFLQEYGPEIADTIAAAVSGLTDRSGQGNASAAPVACPYASATPGPVATATPSLPRITGPVKPESGGFDVYQSFDDQGAPQYVGITSQGLGTRENQHQSNRGKPADFTISGIPGLTGISEADAHDVEEALIDYYRSSGY